MIELLIFSFVAGILTILAPCILPVLPIILGGSAVMSNGPKQKHSLLHPIIVITSLLASIIAFTLLLKLSTALLGIPSTVWSVISGLIITLFGINLLAPAAWEKFMLASGFTTFTSHLMNGSQQKSNITKDILLGASLGPIFNSCSPTYLLIVATILPQSFFTGLSYLGAYALGLGLVLLLIAIFGRALVGKLKWMANPHGAFQKIIGCVFLVVGIGIMFGADKHIQTYVLNNGLYDPVKQIEESFSLR